MRQGKLALKQNDPKKWRQYLVGLWRRKQNRSEVKCLYESKLTLAEAMLGGFVAAYPALKLPVVFDNWYTQPLVGLSTRGCGGPMLGHSPPMTRWS